MKEQIYWLVRLSEIDDAASSVQQELSDLPTQLEETRTSHSRLQLLLEGEKKQLAEAEALLLQQKQEAAEIGERLSRAKGKGAKAQNAREMEAAEREMDGLRRNARDKEEEQERLNAAIGEKRETMAGRQAKFDDFAALYEKEKASAEKRIAELQAELAEKTQGRDNYVGQLPKTLFKRYERIRTKMGNAVVEAKDGTCMGCRLQLPPQQYNLLFRGNEVDQCPQCVRILFVRDAIAEFYVSDPNYQAPPAQEAEEGAPEVVDAEKTVTATSEA